MPASFSLCLQFPLPLALSVTLCLCIYLSLSGVVNNICWTPGCCIGLHLQNARSCIALLGSPPALPQFICCMYLSQIQPLLHWGLRHAVHMLTLLPPTEMSHQGEAFSGAHINSCLLVAWEMLKYIHLQGLSPRATTKLSVWPSQCFAVFSMLKWLFFFFKQTHNVFFSLTRAG